MDTAATRRHLIDPRGDVSPEARVAHDEPGPATYSDRYRSPTTSRWISFVLVAVIHAALLYAVVASKIVVPPHPVTVPLVVNLIPLPPPAPTSKPVERRLAVRPSAPVPERITAPVSIPTTPSPNSIAPVPVAPTPPRPTSPPTAEAPPKPQVTGPVSVDNLTTRLLSATPPSYPVESRRRRESGTVVMLVVVGEDGHVDDLSVSQTSGSDRLDRAALEAVRRWRWAPTVIDGRPARVKGFVRIPFLLRDAGGSGN